MDLPRLPAPKRVYPSNICSPPTPQDVLNGTRPYPRTPSDWSTRGEPRFDAAPRRRQPVQTEPVEPGRDGGDGGEAGWGGDEEGRPVRAQESGAEHGGQRGGGGPQAKPAAPATNAQQQPQQLRHPLPAKPAPAAAPPPRQQQQQVQQPQPNPNRIHGTVLARPSFLETLSPSFSQAHFQGNLVIHAQYRGFDFVTSGIGSGRIGFACSTPGCSWQAVISPFGFAYKFEEAASSFVHTHEDVPAGRAEKDGSASKSGAASGGGAAGKGAKKKKSTSSRKSAPTSDGQSGAGTTATDGGGNEFVFQETAVLEDAEDDGVSSDSSEDGDLPGTIKSRGKRQQQISVVDMDKIVGHEGNVPPRLATMNILCRFSGPRSNSTFRKVSRRLLKFGARVNKAVDDAESATNDGSNAGNAPTAAEDGKNRVALFFKVSAAGNDPFRWRDGPQQLPEGYHGCDFIKRLQHQQQPPRRVLIVGAAGLSTWKKPLIQFIQSSHKDTTILWSLRQGSHVIKIDKSKMLDALEGRDGGPLHNKLVKEIQVQAEVRKDQAAALDPGATERNRVPNDTRFAAQEESSKSKNLCEMGCGKRRELGNRCWKCAIDKPLCQHVDKDGERCRNQGVFDSRTHCDKHRNGKPACSECGREGLRLVLNGKCTKCQSPEWKKAKAAYQRVLSRKNPRDRSKAGIAAKERAKKEKREKEGSGGREGSGEREESVPSGEEEFEEEDWEEEKDEEEFEENGEGDDDAEEREDEAEEGEGYSSDDELEYEDAGGGR